MMYINRNDAIRWQIDEFLSDGNSNVCIGIVCIFIIVKVTEYNIRNGSIRWKISTSIKVILDRVFSSSHRFRDIHISKFVTLKM